MNVLLLEESGGCRARLSERLPAAGCNVVACVVDLKELEAAVPRYDAAMIVVDLARPDRDVVEQVGSLARRHDRPAAIFVEETDAESIQLAVRAGISSYVVRGAHVDRLHDALAVAQARFVEERALRSELDAVRTSLVDRKLIERAKGRLMKTEGLDEQGAYDALRKIAMRRNCRIVEVARAVLADQAGR